MKRARKNRFAASSNVYVHQARNTLISLLLIGVALYIGMLGYHYFEKMNWVDSFLNASMILSGMGPADKINTVAGKVFAGSYALFSGLAFIAIVVLILSPVIHVFFRKIHLESEQDQE